MTLEARKTALAFAWLRWSVFVSSSRGAQISSCQKLWRGLLGNRKRNRGKATCPDRLRRSNVDTRFRLHLHRCRLRLHCRI